MTKLTRVIALICVAALLCSSPTAAYATSGTTSDGVERVQEIESLRETNSETYLMSDGSYECVVYAEDKYYFDETDTLHAIDNSIEAVDYASTAPGQYKNVSNAFDVYFSDNNSPRVTISYRDSVIAFEPVSTFDEYSVDTGILASSVTSTMTVGKIEDCDILDSIVATGANTVKYTNAFNKTDLVYVVDNSELKEYIIINGNDAPNYFDFVFELEGLSIQEIDGQYCFIDAEGNIVFALGTLYAVDSNEIVTESVTYTVSELDDANTIQIRVSVDKEYLLDTNRAYPVIVDPTVLISSASTADAYVSSTNATTNYYTNVYLRTGRDEPYGIRRSYIKFSIPASVPQNGVTNASLEIEKVSGDVPSIRAYRCTASWSSSTITWENKPSFSYVNPSKNAFPRSSGSSWYAMDVTKIVQSWVNGTYTNYGFVIKDISESDSTHWTTFYSSDAASPHKPELHISYNTTGKTLSDVPTNLRSTAEHLCIPCAITNVAAYWSVNGFSQFGCSTAATQETMAKSVHGTMKSAGSASANAYIPNGFRIFSHDTGTVVYGLQSTNCWRSDDAFTYDDIVEEIEAGRPLLLGFAGTSDSPFGVGHMTVCAGYLKSGANYYVIVSDAHYGYLRQIAFNIDTYNDFIAKVNISYK